MPEAKIINLIGGPNTGKTTTALGLTYYLKLAGLRVAYASEYATDMVLEERSNILEDQLYILAKQNRRLHRLREICDFIITDSPLLLSLVYAKDDDTREFRDLLWSYWNSYDNVMFYHPRDTQFSYQGQYRIQQSHVECEPIDTKMTAIMPADTIRLRLGENYISQIVQHLGLNVDLRGLVSPLFTKAA